MYMIVCINDIVVLCCVVVCSSMIQIDCISYVLVINDMYQFVIDCYMYINVMLLVICITYSYSYMIVLVSCYVSMYCYVLVMYMYV